MSAAYDVIIIGGGIAGSSAAFAAARLKHRVVVIDKGMETSFWGNWGKIRSFPGLPEPVSGKELITNIRRQAEAVGAEFHHATVTSVDFSKQPFEIKKSDETTVSARLVILATGAATRTNYIPGERELLGRGAFHNALTNGPAVNGQSVAVVGKTAKACDEALLLTRFAAKVHLIIPSAKLDVPETTFKKVEANNRIERHYSTSVKCINGTDEVRSLTILSSGEEKDFPVNAVFSYVHDYQATNEFLKGQVEMVDGKILVDDDLATSTKGVFACGDILCGQPQLPALSAAQGLIAGLSAEKYLIK